MTQSIERAIKVMFLVAKSPNGRSLTDVVRETGISKPTAFRLLRTLTELGMFRNEPGQRRYCAGTGLFQLAGVLFQNDPLRETALPHMEKLREQTQETVTLVIQEDMERVTIEALPSFHELRLVPTVYSRRPVHLGAPGKALLAFKPNRDVERVIEETSLKAWTPSSVSDPDEFRKDLARVRQRGYATSREETSAGGGATAAPIFNARGDVIGVVNVFGPVFRMTPKNLKKYGELTAATAAAISADMGAQNINVA